MYMPNYFNVSDGGEGWKERGRLTLATSRLGPPMLSVY
jgi:hypothetical protein